MISFFWRIIFSILLAIPCGFAQSSDNTSSSIVVGQKVPLTSAVLGETRTLHIGLPKDYEQSDERYPVLFVLDAGMNFPVTAAMVRYLAAYGTIPEMIVVGVENLSQETRNRDFTPTAYRGSGHRYATSGGADRFLKFFRQELIPHIDSTYRTHPFRILVGHSLGGLFSNHALINAPDLFGAIVSISPSVWWNDFEPLQTLKDFMAAGPRLNLFYQCSLADEGDQEDVRMLEALCASIAKQGGSDFTCRFRHYPEQNHASTIIPATLNALESLYADWRLPWPVIQKGLSAIQAHYEALSKRFRYEIPMDHDALHQAACSALVGGLADQAIEMLEYNARRDPDDAPTHQILSEAWEAKGDGVKALEAASRALEIDPQSVKYQERVARLKTKQ